MTALLSRPSYFELEQADTLAIVRFTPELILTGDKAEDAGNYLLQLVQKAEVFRLVLDFGNVASLSSLMLAKLIRLHKELQSRAGWLALCNLSSDLYQILETTGLTRMLRIYRQPPEPS